MITRFYNFTIFILGRLFFRKGHKKRLLFSQKPLSYSGFEPLTHALKGKVKLPSVALYITKVIFQSCEFICIIMNYFIDYNWYFLSYFEFWYPFWYRPFSFLGMVRLSSSAPGLHSQTFRVLCASNNYKCRLPEKVANRVFTHSASLRYASFVHTLFAFTSGLARWPLSKLAGKQWKHSQLQSLRYRFADPSLCASACFREKQSL